MAKKVRKPRSASPRTYGQAGVQSTSSTPKATPAARPVSRPSTAAQQIAARPVKNVDLRAEYPYVGPDLRRLLLTAAAMFAVLILLNLAFTLVR